MPTLRVRPPVDPVRPAEGRPSSRGRRNRHLIIVAVVAAAALAGADALYAQTYRGRTYPGVAVVGQPAGGLTADQLRTSLQERADRLSEVGLSYRGRERTVNLNPAAASTGDLDLVYRWLEIDVNATVAAAMSRGRSGNLAADALTHLTTLVGSSFVPARMSIDRARLRQALDENFGDLLTPAKPVGIQLTTTGLQLTDSASGERWDYDSAVAETAALAERLTPGEVQLRAVPDLPSLSRTEVPAAAIEQARALLEVEVVPLTLVPTDGSSHRIDSVTLERWLRFERRAGQVILTADRATVENYLATSVAPLIDTPSAAMKFSIESDKVVEFQPATDGRRLDLTESASAITAAIEAGQREAQLVVQVEPAPPSPDDVVGRSIRELVGVGRSNFAGSPKNRQHNIAVGAAAVNGTLIQPGEEFSLLKTLGEIDAAAGYLPELVIKGNRTIPEYGGGLCQIGTTTFRSALAAGTKITERRNHSYRVVYYEPAGTDATIYDPAPDFKFVNDYPTPLLFQTHIDGDELTFELWGTSDGRVVTSTKPTIYNVRPPPPRREVPTTDIPVGQVKCTERAHSGADTSFTYTVTYPDGSVHEEEFRSHYVPWQEVCLVGVTAEQLASSTPDSLPDADASGAAGT